MKEYRLVSAKVLERYDSMLRAREFRRAAQNPSQLMPSLVRPRVGLNMPTLNPNRLKMEILDKKITINQTTFQPYLELTVSIPIESYQDSSWSEVERETFIGRQLIIAMKKYNETAIRLNKMVNGLFNI